MQFQGTLISLDLDLELETSCVSLPVSVGGRILIYSRSRSRSRSRLDPNSSRSLQLQKTVYLNTCPVFVFTSDTMCNYCGLFDMEMNQQVFYEVLMCL